MAVTYRRRADNPGFKAGNIRDFCERWGERHDFMLVLDADSLMEATSSCAWCAPCSGLRSSASCKP
jgi:membrane glycosyltransferase